MTQKSILIVDDNAVATEMLCQLLQDAGYEAVGVLSGEDALERYRHNSYDVVITDMQLPGIDGLELLRFIKDKRPDTEVIVITAYATIEMAVQAIKMGAYDFITKPVNPHELEHKVRTAVERQGMREELERLHDENAYLREEALASASPIIGRSAAMRRVMEYADRVAQGNSTVLIRGESGTGKELVARAIHERGPWAARPFIRVNSAALAEGILESELFGHERGSFTGAFRRKLGKFELAKDGTLFLDEIGDISLNAQAKLLRCLQEREFERVGGHETLKVGCRIIAATNRPLETLIGDGRFRQDLFYRLNVVPIHIPPLRERKDDLLDLISEFLKRFNRKFSKQVSGLSPEGMLRFMDYEWPGNIRELENIVERGVVLGSLEVEAEALPILETRKSFGITGFSHGGELGLAEYLEKIERQILSDAFRRSDGNKSQAAALLGIDRNLLRYKLTKYKII